jgi:hypothetical protein
MGCLTQLYNEQLQKLQVTIVMISLCSISEKNHGKSDETNNNRACKPSLEPQVSAVSCQHNPVSETARMRSTERDEGSIGKVPGKDENQGVSQKIEAQKIERRPRS